MNTLLGRWKTLWNSVQDLPRIRSLQSEHEKRIQELERELDLSSEPSQFGNKLQRRRHLELLKDTPLTPDEEAQWQAGM